MALIIAGVAILIIIAAACFGLGLIVGMKAINNTIKD